MQVRPTVLKYRLRKRSDGGVVISKKISKPRKSGVPAEVPDDPYNLTLNVAVNRRMRDEIDSVADRAGVSRSAVIRLAINEFLNGRSGDAR